MTEHVTRATIHRYLDGEMTWEEKQRLRAHVSECAACRAELEALRRAEYALRQMAVLDVPDDFPAQVLRRVRAEAHRPFWSRGPVTWVGHALVALGAGLLLLMLSEISWVLGGVVAAVAGFGGSDPAQVSRLLGEVALQAGETALPLALALLALGLFIEVGRWLPWTATSPAPNGAWNRHGRAA